MASENQLWDTIKTVMVPIHPAGWPFVTGFAVITAFLAFLSSFLGFIGIVATAWCIYFFRNPVRITPQREGLIISPADGVVQSITRVTPAEELHLGSEPRTRISIFLNVFDVHVNRVPASGKVTHSTYHPGLFLNASLDKASEHNERQMITMELEADADEQPKTMAFVQIAGLVARRIICNLSKNQGVVAGEVFGLIRFGSRADIYLPLGVEPLVLEGQRMIGGETVLADMKHPDDVREPLAQ